MNAQNRFLGAIDARSIDDRRVELSFSSETPVSRTYGLEILSHDPADVDLSRLLAAGPLLHNHDHAELLGVVEKAWLDTAARRGRAIVRFSASSRASEFLADVRDGIRVSVSVGYSVTGATQIGTKDGEAVFRLAWQPFEISLVSVPADTTVGVGRSLPLGGAATRSAAPSAKTDSLAARLAEAVGQRVTPMNLLAARAGERHRAGQEPRPFSVGLTDVFVPVRNTGRPVEAQWHRLGEAVLGASRLLSAGVGLVVWHEDPSRVQVFGPVGLETRPGVMRIVEPAAFSEIPETAAFASASATTAVIPAGDLPWSEAAIDFSSGVHSRRAFAVVLKHSDLRSTESLFEALAKSIALGLARAVDEVLLAALEASTPAVFSLAAAAAAGRSFSELRGLVGTNGAGASIDASGALRCAGIPGELTSESSESFVIAPSRLAVAAHERIDLLVGPVQRNGSVTVTAWIDLLPLTPSPDTSVWEVVA